MWLLLLLPLALAGVEVSLPAGESISDWAEALQLVDGEVGPATAAPCVRIVDPGGGAAWRITVLDREGVAHVLHPSPPASRADREDLLVTAMSLVEPLPTLALPELPPLPAAPKAPVRARVPAPPPVVVPAPVPVQVAAPEPPPPPPPRVVEPVIVDVPELERQVEPEPPTPPRWSILPSLGAGASFRPGQVPAAAFGLAISLRPPQGLLAPRLLIRAQPRARLRIEGTGQDEAMGAWALRAGITSDPQAPWWLGLGAGPDLRRWWSDSTAIARTATPVAELWAGVALPSAARLRGSLELAATADLAPTRLSVGGEGLGDLFRFSVGTALGIQWNSRSR